MEGEVEPVPAAPLLPSDVKYDEKKMLLHKPDRWRFKIQIQIPEVNFFLNI